MFRLMKFATSVRLPGSIRSIHIRTLYTHPENGDSIQADDTDTFGNLNPKFLDSKSIRQIRQAKAHERKRENSRLRRRENPKSRMDNDSDHERDSSFGPVTPMDFQRSRTFTLLSDGESDQFGTLTSEAEFKQRYPDAFDNGDFEKETEDDHHIRLSKFDRKHNQAWYDHRLIKVSKRGEVLEALKFLREQMIGKDRVMPTKVSYTVVISALGKAGYTTLAFKLFYEMRERGIKAPKHVFSALFNACANCPDKKKGLRLAHYLRDYMMRKDSPRHYINYKAQMKAFAWTGDIQTAFATLDEALADGNILDQEACSMLLMGCVSDRENGFRHAIKVWRIMLEHGLRPDIHQYNLLVRCTLECSIEDPRHLKRLLRPPKSVRTKQRLVNSGSVREYTSSNEDYGFDRSLESKRCTVVDDLSDITIESPEIEGKTNGDDVQKMEERQRLSPPSIPDILSPRPNLENLVAIETVTNAADRLALLGGVDGFLLRMRKDKVKPDIKTFTMLVDCVNSDENTELELIERMDECGVELDTPFCNMLMRKRIFRSEEESAKEVLELMGSRQLIPDLHTYATLALTCHSKAEAAQLLENIEAQDVAVTTEIFSHLNQAAYLNFNYRQWLCQEMSERGLLPDERFIRQCEARIKQASSMILQWDRVRRQREREINFRQKFKYFNLFYKTWLLKTKLRETSKEPTKFRDLEWKDSEEIEFPDEVESGR